MAIHTDFKFHPQVTQIGCYWGAGGHTELYLLEGDQLAIIDTGCIDTPREYIAPALEFVGRSLADVDVIINTHGHFDHAGGDAALVAASGAKVWMPEPDVEIAESIERQFALYFAQNDTLVGRADRLDASLAAFRKQLDPVKVDRALKPDEVLDLGRGIELHVVPTPGHTIGSASFYWPREGMLFTGDSVPGAGSRPRQLPLIYFPADYERTIDRLLTLDVNTLCVGHHYCSLSLTRESVKTGRSGKQFIAESGQIAQIIAEGVEKAVRANPGAPFLDAARAAVPLITERLPLDLSPETGLPGLASLYSNWQRYSEAR